MAFTGHDTWRTRDGREVKIADMDDGHLVNTIAFLRRNAERYRLTMIVRMGRYVANAPDGAAMACELEAIRLGNADTDEVLAYCITSWRALIAEAQRRQLPVRVEPTDRDPMGYDPRDDMSPGSWGGD